MVDGGSMGTGCHEPSSDTVDLELDIDRAMMMQTHLQKFQVTAPSSKHLGLTKPRAPAKPPAQEKSRKRAPSSASAEPPPPSPSASPTHTEPAPFDSDEDEESGEEDATGRRKASITQMLNEHQEEELAEW